MKKLFLIVLCTALLFGCAGMPTIQFQTASQEQVAKIAVSIGSKAIGLKLKAMGFVWTEEIEIFYQMITAQDQLTLDAAQMAEGYIRENVDPLIQDDVFELAKLIGIKFDYDGQVSDTRTVKIELLKVAATGFRLAANSKP
jgi:hypothetical protein